VEIVQLELYDRADDQVLLLERSHGGGAEALQFTGVEPHHDVGGLSST